MGYSNAPAEETDPGYDRDYFERNYAPLVARQSEEARHCLRRIRDVVPAGSLLDYGCGTGVFLRVAAEEFGYRANVGVDVSGAALTIARESTDGDVDWVHLPHQAVPERKFEVVCFMNSLAGLKDARQIVETIRDRHLAPGGALVIRTPDIPSRYLRRVTRWAPILGPTLTAAFVFGKARHLLFDHDTLTRFLGNLGFDLVSVELRPEHPIPIRFDSVSGAAKSFALRRLQVRHSILAIATESGSALNPVQGALER